MQVVVLLRSTDGRCASKCPDDGGDGGGDRGEARPFPASGSEVEATTEQHDHDDGSKDLPEDRNGSLCAIVPPSVAGMSFGHCQNALSRARQDTVEMCQQVRMRKGPLVGPELRRDLLPLSDLLLLLLLRASALARAARLRNVGLIAFRPVRAGLSSADLLGVVLVARVRSRIANLSRRAAKPVGRWPERSCVNA
jgi:hypothetical protein